MLSANATSTNVQKALQQGAKGFIAKPFTKKKLQEVLEKHARA
jgi:CheY-like chemotaxis protein